jgi:hypothetical protein
LLEIDHTQILRPAQTLQYTIFYCIYNHRCTVYCICYCDFFLFYSILYHSIECFDFSIFKFRYSRKSVDRDINNRLVPSETQCLLENISLGRTDALSAHRLFWSVLSLSQPFNARYAVEYLFFARILALCRAQVITIPTIRMGSLHSITPMRIVGIVITRAQHTAKIRAISLIVSEKNYFASIIAHLCSEMAVFCQKSLLFLPSD